MMGFDIGFQDSATPIMEGIVDLHNNIMFYIIVILVFVQYIFVTILWDFAGKVLLARSVKDLEFRQVMLQGSELTHAPVLEIIWTLIPSIILTLIAVPSFSLLYSMDEIIDPSITIKAVGHQWYWSYEYTDYTFRSGEASMDSYMLPTDNLLEGQFRLLEVDNTIILPTMVHIRVIVTAADVLHSWAVPALGVKIDAVPGRLNQVSLFLKREGHYYGQCSELCGVNHGYMPTQVWAVPMFYYLYAIAMITR